MGAIRLLQQQQVTRPVRYVYVQTDRTTTPGPWIPTTTVIPGPPVTLPPPGPPPLSPEPSLLAPNTHVYALWPDDILFDEVSFGPSMDLIRRDRLTSRLSAFVQTCSLRSESFFPLIVKRMTRVFRSHPSLSTKQQNSSVFRSIVVSLSRMSSSLDDDVVAAIRFTHNSIIDIICCLLFPSSPRKLVFFSAKSILLHSNTS